jgi:regulator of protease activity HflC (stomatin/prohibitin superfamily)
VQLASTVDLHDLMGPSRLELTGQLRDRIGAKVREERLGIEVVYLGFLGMHPPVPVAPAFQSVVEAQEKALSQVVEAQSYAQRTVPEAKTQGTALVNDAQAERSRQELVGKAEEESFKNHVAAYEQASPAIYRSRYFLTALEEALRGKRKIVLPANLAEESFVIKLEDKLRADLLNIDLEKE